MLLITDNMTATSLADVETSDTGSYPYHCRAGAVYTHPVRIANTGPDAETITLAATGQYAGRVSFSLSARIDYAASLTLTVPAGGLSTTVWIRLELEGTAARETVWTPIGAGLSFGYECVGLWASYQNPYPEFSGTTTDKAIRSFEAKGTVVELLPFIPLTDKRGIGTEARATAWQTWIDPFSDYWQSPHTDPYVAPLAVPVVLGTHDIGGSYPVNVNDIELGYDDAFTLALPPNVFLDRSYCPWGAVQQGGQVLYQRTVFVLHLAGCWYSIEDVQPIFSAKGEFCYWTARARLVFVASTSNSQDWWPWAALYQQDSDIVAHYITARPPLASIERFHALRYYE